MSKETVTFYEMIDKNEEKLDLYTTAITRAHGANHPEVFAVRDLYEAINSKIKEVKPKKPELNVEFSELRRVTNNYSIPEDGCETYAAVYHMLSEIDLAYQAE